MKGWPTSLTGRIALVLLVGLSVAEIAGLAIRGRSDREALSFLEGFEIVERVAATTRLIDATPPDRRAETLALIERRSLQVGLAAASAVPPGVERDATLDTIRAIFAGQTADFATREVRVGYGRRPVSLWPVGTATDGWDVTVRARMDSLMRDFAAGRDFVVAVRLNDGMWLNFAAPYVQSLLAPSTADIASLVLSVIVVFALSVWVVRRLTRPIEAVTAAVERLSVDIDAPPLDETGPREMRRVAAAFNTMQRRIRRFVDDRMNTLAAISHDLRTPITRLRLRAESVEDEKTRGAIVANLEEMEKMIFATLNLGRQEADPESRSAVDLAGLAREIARDSVPKGAVEAVGVRHLPYRCRPIAMRRCVSNLVENALKYGQGARVVVGERDGWVRVAVEDEGPGIPVEERESVFRPFYRLGGQKGGPGAGVGMGLAVARSIARAHGGDVLLSDRPGGGLIAELRLPASPA